MCMENQRHYHLHLDWVGKSSTQSITLCGVKGEDNRFLPLAVSSPASLPSSRFAHIATQSYLFPVSESDEQDKESHPVAGFKGIYQRLAAGSAKSWDGTSKVAYGIEAAQIKKGDEALVPSLGARDVLFLGVESVTSVKDVKKRVTSFVGYAWQLGMDEEASMRLRSRAFQSRLEH